MDKIKDYNLKFITKTLDSSKLFVSNYTAIPSLIFLFTSFIFLYQHIHHNTSLYTKWKTRLLRDFKLHWIYFNGSRLWFIFVGCFRRLISVAEDYIKINLTKEDREFSLIMTYAAALAVISTLALIPSILIYVNYASKYDMPNFFMWVMEDPYLRHEIGISGHCLERPFHIDSKKMKNCPYRSRRSTSFDTNPWITQKPPVICRNCKSMIEQNVVNSLEEL